MGLKDLGLVISFFPALGMKTTYAMHLVCKIIAFIYRYACSRYWIPLISDYP